MSADADAQRLVLRGGGSAAAGYVMRFAARLLFLFVAARLYGAALFGAYSLAIAAAELAVAVGLLGMKRLLFKLLAERPEQRLDAHIVLDAGLIVAATSLLLSVLTMAAVLAVPTTMLAPDTAAALFVVAPMIAGQALIDLFLAATRWKQRMRHEVIARSLVEPYAAIIALIAAYAGGFGETGLLISYWAGTLLALAYALWGARRCFGGYRLGQYRPGRLGPLLKASALPTATDFSSSLFARLDLYLVGAILGEAAAGVYAMARQFRTPIRQVRLGFDGLLTPVLAKTLAATGAQRTGAAAASAGRLVLAIQLPLLVGLVIAGAPLLQWFGPAFAAGYWALVLLAAAETILSAFGIGELILLYRRPALALWIAAASAAVNLAAAWLLIGRFGLEGAALSVLVAVVAATLIRRAVLRSSFGIVVPLSYSAGPVVAAGAAAAAAFLAGRLLAPAPTPVGVALTLAAAFAAYAAALKLWLIGTGQRLALVNIQTER